ncbi:MAG: hypothetical protein R3Y61_06365 [Rikenellaceae bacterium]
MIKTLKNILNSEKFETLSAEALSVNPWVTPEFIATAREAIVQEFLDENKLKHFCLEHNIDTTPKDKRAAIICAGNLPLVGFGDLFYTLLCGWKILLKPSSKDPLMRLFEDIEGVEIIESIENLDTADAIILMGSDKTCALIEELYPSIPKLLRGSMHSIAILPTEPSTGDVEGLYKDIFLYCSKGCRSVSHLYIPRGFDVERLAHILKDTHLSSGYALPKIWHERYTYERATSMLRGDRIIDCGFCLLREAEHHSPTQSLTTITFSYFDNPEEIPDTQIQHIATSENFGRAQYPTLSDFANKESVTEFLGIRL